jgi:molybdopterin converting factor small subunit
VAILRQLPESRRGSLARRERARGLAPGATIGDVWRQLAGEFPELASYERSISSAINADYARMDRVVGEGDEIAFLPPVSGG